MFRATVFRNGEIYDSQLGLNEAAILGGPPYSILDIDMFVDGLLATTYRCDGLIVSTPVGSTAHNMSAGGPILRKDLQAYVRLADQPSHVDLSLGRRFGGSNFRAHGHESKYFHQRGGRWTSAGKFAVWRSNSSPPCKSVFSDA